MTGYTQYYCQSCRAGSRMIPVRPSDAQNSIRAGCERCERITRHKSAMAARRPPA